MTTVLRLSPHRIDGDAIAAAAACLRSGGLVAFPTETVYGLGVAALDAAAVRRLFAAKRRPSEDPLIVHVADAGGLEPLVADRPAVLDALAARFWPGPLTMVLRRSRLVPNEVTAGLDTVGIRVPSHPVARALIAAAGIAVAAPSANLFSRPSPTQAAHVLEDLDGRIDMVLDAGATEVGVESTVLDLSGDTPVVLRPGAVTLDMLRPLLPGVQLRGGGSADGPQRSPGLLTKHYSPRAPLTLYEGDAGRVRERIQKDVATAQAAGRRVGVIEPGEDVAALASRLYASLREFDAAGMDEIFAQLPPATDGLAQAVADRLRRAAAGRIVRC